MKCSIISASVALNSSQVAISSFPWASQKLYTRATDLFLVREDIDLSMMPSSASLSIDYQNRNTRVEIM